MGKKTQKALGRLQSDVQALSEAVWAMKEQVRVETAAESAASTSRRRQSRKLAQLEEALGESDAQGQVSTFGSYRLPSVDGTGRVVRWQMEQAEVQSLMPDDLDHAASVLAAIGHRQRLSIVMVLLRQPTSVSDLVSSLDLGTSGAAYHHLNVLQNAGLVMQQERGTFEMVPEQAGRVAGILAAMAVEPLVEVTAAEAEAEPEPVAAEVQ